MNIRYGNYEIRPTPNRLCWEIFEYREIVDRKTHEKRMDWASTGHFPSFLGGALAQAYEWTLKNSPENCDVQEAIETAQKLHDDLLKLCPKTPKDLEGKRKQAIRKRDKK